MTSDCRTRRAIGRPWPGPGAAGTHRSLPVHTGQDRPSTARCLGQATQSAIGDEQTGAHGALRVPYVSDRNGSGDSYPVEAQSQQWLPQVTDSKSLALPVEQPWEVVDRLKQMADLLGSAFAAGERRIAEVQQQATAQLSTLEAEREAAQRNAAAAWNELERARSRAEQSERSLAEAHAALGQQTAEREAVQRNAAAAWNEAERARNQIEQAERRAIEAEQRGEQADRRVEQAEMTVRQAMAEREEGMRAAEDAFAARRSAEAERDRIAEGATELSRSLEASRGEIATLRAKIADLEMLTQNLQHTAATAGQEIDDARRRTQESEAE